MAVNRIYHPLVVQLGKGGKERERALATIRAALKANNGRLPETAKALDCGVRTLARWLEREESLRQYAADLRARAGIPGPRDARN